MANIQREKLREYRLLAERVGLKPYAESTELALTRQDALKALSLLRDANFPVLGGDVYTRVGDDIRVAYENWYATPIPSEDRDTYVRRSIETSENYIQKYPEQAGEIPLFVLVAAEPNSTFSQEGDRK